MEIFLCKGDENGCLRTGLNQPLWYTFNTCYIVGVFNTLKKVGTDDLSAEYGHNGYCTKGDNNPDDSNCGGGVDLFCLADGHKANKDVGHTEVAETPGKTRGNILPGCFEGSSYEDTGDLFSAV